MRSGQPSLAAGVGCLVSVLLTQAVSSLDLQGAGEASSSADQGAQTGARGPVSGRQGSESAVVSFLSKDAPYGAVFLPMELVGGTFLDHYRFAVQNEGTLESARAAPIDQLLVSRWLEDNQDQGLMGW